MKIRYIFAAACVAVLSGCVGPTDSSGWKSSQKKDFLNILKEDKYLSICEHQALYQKVKDSENSQLMTKLLTEYTDNLANGCLVDASGFNDYRQKVTREDIETRLRAGYTIETILKPYVPEYRQYNQLVTYYNSLSKNENSTESLLNSLRLNIERVKLMKPGLGKSYALVNIPEYQVHIIDEDVSVVNMNVVVGTKKNQTPIFSENLKYITLNPAWNVPDSIARNEIIPKTLRNPGYLKSHRLVMRKDYNLNSTPLSFNSVNPRSYVGGKGYVPFKFIEVPSSRNALGRVKFIFPNHHSVYMHDTPAKSLFKRKIRAYSHGCIRLADPKYMLEFIVKNYTAHDYKDVKKKYDSMKTHYLKINRNLPVHTAYLTAYVDDDGKLLTFSDIYSFDKKQKLNF